MRKVLGFEDAIRGAVSLGGDTDTIATITDAIAEVAFGIPMSLRVLGAIDDNHVNAVLSMDSLPMERAGIQAINIVDWLPGL